MKKGHFIKSLFLSYYFALSTLCVGFRIEISNEITFDNCTEFLDLLEDKVSNLSQRWHNFTQKTQLFSEVQVSLPSSFQKCLSERSQAPYNQETKVDITVFRSGPFLSKQFGPCGTQGMGINLPISSLMDSETDTILRAWVNSNYGVFLESLHHSDVWHSNETSNRQELLCYGKSVKEVAQWLHPGEDLSITRDFLPPRFIYQIQPKKRAYVLMIQKSFPELITNKNNEGITWEALQSALLPFISSLPSGDQLAIITYDQREAEVNLPITMLTDDNRRILHASIPRRSVPNQHLSLDACHDCGFRMASRLSSFEAEVEVKHVLIVRSGKVLEDHRANFRTLSPIVIGLDRSIDRSWSELSSRMHVIEQCTETRVCQASIARHIIEAVENDYQTKLNVEKAVGTITKKFNVGLAANRILVVATAKSERDIASLALTSPSGKISMYPFYTHNMAYLDIPNDHLESGEWQVSGRMYSEIDAFTLDVFVSNDIEQKPLEAWVDSHIDQVGHPKITLYAKFTQPVKNIIAFVSRPGHRGKDLPIVQVPLMDSGTGYPDILPNDHIYSAYFTELSPEAGFYQVLVRAEDELGQVFQSHAKAFHVSQMPSSFYVRKEPGSRLLVSDVFPPNRITDLGVVGVVGDAQLFVTLNWTAPGGDFDHGSAFRYEIRCATSPSALREDTYLEQSIPVHASLIPQPEKVGTVQRCTVGVPWHNQIFYYGIVAYDASGNRGLMSNSVPVIVVKEEDNEIILDETTTESSADALPRSAVNTEAIAAYVWAPVLALVLMTLIVVSAWAFYKRNFPSKEYDCDEKSNESWSQDENCSTTTSSAGVSTNITIEDDLSVADQKMDIWSATIEYGGPRIHVMEDFTVYRDLSTISDVPSEYCHLDQMLSALLAAKQLQIQQKHNESLV